MLPWNAPSATESPRCIVQNVLRTKSLQGQTSLPKSAEIYPSEKPEMTRVEIVSVKASESSKITLIKAQHVAVDASPEETYLRLMATTGTDHVTNYNQLTNPYFPK